ncbi:MAG: hypothetical protein FWE74_10335 [Oscillospiraceae bacterium]|nr:hypothetical protein [Oscillospiraceae bacterium]
MNINNIDTYQFSINKSRNYFGGVIAAKTFLFDNTTRFYLRPKAGKQGESVTVVEEKTKREHKYNEDDTAYMIIMFSFTNVAKT